MSIYDSLQQSFQQIFKTNTSLRYFFAPGRINLIGEHTDYNGGHVFPASISFGTYAVGSKRTDQKIRLYSMNFPDKGIIECELNDLEYDKKHNWANYPKGMIKFISEQNFPIHTGMDILYYGNIPNGAGLSSSASIEMVTGVLINELFACHLDRIKMIKLGQQVENNYIGIASGIMDQFAVGMGKKNYAIHLNTNTLEYKYAPVDLTYHSIIIIHTNKNRNLHESKYNERRAQCEDALEDLQVKLDIHSLGELTPQEFDKYQHLITNKTNQKRAKHAVYENARTVEALLELQTNNLQKFGQLMNASHLSLKNDYEVTGLELDTIVESAWKQPGVLGARMTGAGFGGCAIAIVENDYIDSFQEQVQKDYIEKVGYEAIFYTATIGDSAKEIIQEVI